MALSLKDPETDRLARELARITGESLTSAVRRALAERLARERRKGKQTINAEGLDEIVRRWQSLPVLDNRTADEIIGYDENGVPS